MRTIAFVLAAWALQCAAQSAPVLALPLDCEVGTTCIVQNHVDHEARDYRCGFLTYPGHKGTDIRVIDHDEFVRGVAVMAAAAGRVRATRDGMEDVSMRAPGAASIAGREAGNSVVLEHGEGWETQYAHLRRGSVKVRPGDYVERGDPLGVAGLSGETEFPHLHFEVRRAGKTVDPFVGVEGGSPCSAGGAPLWGTRALRALEYRASGVVDAGISGGAPVLANGDLDRASLKPLARASGEAIFWAQVYGLQQGDVQEIRLLGPGGKVIGERRTPVTRNLAQSLAYVGTSRRFFSWSAGTYRGEYVLYRGKDKVLAFSRDVSLGKE